jgi:hypothetical protein
MRLRTRWASVQIQPLDRRPRLLAGCAAGRLDLFHKLWGGEFLGDAGASLSVRSDRLSRHPGGYSQLQTLQSPIHRYYPLGGERSRKRTGENTNAGCSKALRPEREEKGRLASR